MHLENTADRKKREELSKTLFSLRKLYFAGIAGCGMYGLARLASDLGFSVSGTDAQTNENTLRLEKNGIAVYSEKDGIPRDADALVYTTALPDAHPLLEEARERGLSLYTRAELLGLLSDRFSVRIAVAGTHGKSSTVGMLAEILRESEYAPTVLVGADLNADEGGYRKGKGDAILLEACEYADAFLALRPTHALVLNLEWEHTDYFKNEESVRLSFQRFLSGEACLHRVVSAESGLRGSTVYGTRDGLHAECRSESNGCPLFTLMYGECSLARIALGVVGQHQVENALGALALAQALGVSLDQATDALTRFRGVGGRMQKVKHINGVPLYLDYAHHPTELAAALQSASLLAPRIACVFEPHTYSRLRTFFKDYVSLLQGVSAVGVLPVYAAREKDDGEENASRLALAVGGVCLHDFSSAAAFLRMHAKKGTVLLLVGAGRVREVLPFME